MGEREEEGEEGDGGGEEEGGGLRCLGGRGADGPGGVGRRGQCWGWGG